MPLLVCLLARTVVLLETPASKVLHRAKILQRPDLVWWNKHRRFKAPTRIHQLGYKYKYSILFIYYFLFS